MFALSCDFLVLERPFEICPESGQDRIDSIWLTCDLSDRKIEEEQNCISWIIFGSWIIFRRTNQKKKNKTDSMVSLDFHFEIVGMV